MRSKFADRPDLMEKMLPDFPPLSIRPVFVDREYSIYDALLLDHVSLGIRSDQQGHGDWYRPGGRDGVSR